LAAAQIRTNSSAFTPEHERRAIEEHAADEDRHARLLLGMRPLAELPDERHQELARRLSHIAGQFVIGYFGNPLLVTARNKHAAYAHGALTIEQFPFQVYVAYLKVTKLPAVKSGLPDVIRDEKDHLALGRRLIDQLPEPQKLSIERLMVIEEDMCLRMMRRMNDVMTEFLSDRTGLTEISLERCLSSSHSATLAWAYTLGCAEELAAQHMQKVYSARGLEFPEMMPAHVSDELRHSKLLRRAVQLERRRLSSRDPGYPQLEKTFMRGMRLYQMKLFSSLMKRFSEPDAIYLYGALALETRVFKHYKDLAQTTDHIGLSHVLSMILEEEAEHTRQASSALHEHGLSLDAFREIARVERAHWDEWVRTAKKALDHYLSGTERAQVS
jgi:rubrerythrin